MLLVSHNISWLVHVVCDNQQKVNEMPFDKSRLFKSLLHFRILSEIQTSTTTLKWYLCCHSA